MTTIQSKLLSNGKIPIHNKINEDKSKDAISVFLITTSGIAIGSTKTHKIAYYSLYINYT